MDRRRRAHRRQSHAKHAQELWAGDFLAHYTALFAVVYVFVIMEIDSRRIVHVNVTTHRA